MSRVPKMTQPVAADSREKMAVLREDVDAWAARVRTRATCQGKGCFGCCRASTARVAPDEAERILPHLSDEARAQVQRFKSASPVALCPLLVKGACSVYEERPLVCRVYFSASPPVDCFFEHGIKNIAYFGPNTALTVRLAEAWGDDPRSLVDELKRLMSTESP